jgi:hypothetical protein
MARETIVTCDRCGEGMGTWTMVGYGPNNCTDLCKGCEAAYYKWISPSEADAFFAEKDLTPEDLDTLTHSIGADYCDEDGNRIETPPTEGDGIPLVLERHDRGSELGASLLLAAMFPDITREKMRDVTPYLANEFREYRAKGRDTLI